MTLINFRCDKEKIFLGHINEQGRIEASGNFMWWGIIKASAYFEGKYSMCLEAKHLLTENVLTVTFYPRNQPIF